MTTRWVASIALAMVMALASCSEEKRPLSLTRTHEDASADEEDPPLPVTRDGGGGSVPLAGVDAGANDCTDRACGLHGDCVTEGAPVPHCVCDVGYVANPGESDDGICVEDKSCVKARILTCLWNGGSNIKAHFSLSYCSGNPYLGLDVNDLLVDEKGNEDFEPLLPSESSATIMPHEFTEHVYVVLDISNSIKQSDVLDDIAGGLQKLLDALVAQGGQYRFAVFLFDGKPYLYEFIKDTTDLEGARDALSKLAGQGGSDPSSSNVYGAVIEGVHQIDRARTLRELVSQYGLLTTGTLIVVSDGDDRSSTRTFADVMTTVTATRSNVITVGLGDVANFPKLTAIGRDGSFSASEPALIGAAFEQIAERINLTGESLYFFGYCTPTRKGNFDMRIGVKGLDFPRPTCTFNADGFVGACDESNFDRAVACEGRECGGLICGECEAGSCCYAGQCIAPGNRSEDEVCGHEWMCDSNLTCEADACKPTVAPGAACGGEDRCNLGESYCGQTDPPPDPAPPASCQPAREDGSACKMGFECQTGTCAVDPDAPTAASLICMEPGQMFSPCGGNIACEPGSYCDGTLCKPAINAGACTANKECVTGNCLMVGSGTKICGSAPTCLFTHDL